MKIFRLAAGFFILWCGLTAAHARIRPRVQFAELPNLFYQLDCVAGERVNCARENLAKLWETEFLRTDEDRRLLKEWARLRAVYDRQIILSDQTEDDPVVSLFDKIRIAGLQTQSLEDYALKLDLLTAPADRRAFERVARHFAPKFKRWWMGAAVGQGAEFAREMSALLASDEIARRINQFYDFYAPDLPADYEIAFNLFYIPGDLPEPTSGQQLENYSLVEFRQGERAAQRVDVAVHELCHFFYAGRTAQAKKSLAEKFYALDRASAIPAYNLLNETLAAAFGNGMIARAVMTEKEFETYRTIPRAFYNHAAIDRAAKASLAPLDSQLENQQTIADPDFPAQFARWLETAFGAELLAPKLQLMEVFLFVDESFNSQGALRGAARQSLDAAQYYTVEATPNRKSLSEFYARPQLNALFVARPENLRALAARKILTPAEVRLIERALAAQPFVLFRKDRAPTGSVYVISAHDAARAENGIVRLAQIQQFSGIYRE